MSLLRGSLTYSRFFVQGEIPDDHRERFMRAIRLRVMRPLAPDDEDLERTGFCLVSNPEGLELSYGDVFYNEYINLGVRTDRWAIPGAMLKAKVREAERALLEKRGAPKLSRKDKAELKELVAKRLRHKLTPQSRVVDLSWSLNEGLVRFFSHSPKAAVNMVELFARTFKAFGIELLPESPHTLAMRVGLSRSQESAWASLETVDIATGGDDS